MKSYYIPQANHTQSIILHTKKKNHRKIGFLKSTNFNVADHMYNFPQTFPLAASKNHHQHHQTAAYVLVLVQNPLTSKLHS